MPVNRQFFDDISRDISLVFILSTIEHFAISDMEPSFIEKVWKMYRRSVATSHATSNGNETGISLIFDAIDSRLIDGYSK